MRVPARLFAAVGLVLATAGVSAQDTPVALSGFAIERIATVREARELAFAPNGDLFVGTSGSSIYIIPNAASAAATPEVFATFDDAPAAGVAFSEGALVVGANRGVYRIEYRPGDRKARSQPQKLASVRTRGGRGHATTSVAVRGTTIFASVGSSCNACDPEMDETRATIGEVRADGKLQPVAIRIRNAIALAINPATGSLWAGVAGQDELEKGHPYEIFDPVGVHSPPADYGWPHCYENRRATGNRNCASAVVPRVVFPAYSTPIGAVFYPEKARGKYAFPEQYAGGAFVTLHGSWHRPLVPPRVVFVPASGDNPKRSVDWRDPSAQWTEFLGGYQNSAGTRMGRPTGIAVGPEGDLFVADDHSGAIYRIRPSRSN